MERTFLSSSVAEGSWDLWRRGNRPFYGPKEQEHFISRWKHVAWVDITTTEAGSFHPKTACSFDVISVSSLFTMTASVDDFF